MGPEEDFRVQVQTEGHELQNLQAQLGAAPEERRVADLEVRQDSRGHVLLGGQNQDQNRPPAAGLGRGRYRVWVQDRRVVGLLQVPGSLWIQPERHGSDQERGRVRKRSCPGLRSHLSISRDTQPWFWFWAKLPLLEARFTSSGCRKNLWETSRTRSTCRKGRGSGWAQVSMVTA